MTGRGHALSTSSHNVKKPNEFISKTLTFLRLLELGHTYIVHILIFFRKVQFKIRQIASNTKINIFFLTETLILFLLKCICNHTMMHSAYTAHPHFRTIFPNLAHCDIQRNRLDEGNHRGRLIKTINRGKFSQELCR